MKMVGKVAYLPKPELGIAFVIDLRPGHPVHRKIKYTEFLGIASRETVEVLTPDPPSNEASFGWGDRIEKGLTSVGITQERYKEVKERFGLPSTCDCDERIEWINKVEKWFKSLL